jgi:tubulin delta
MYVSQGQCGNQVGYGTLDAISKHSEYDVSPFFREEREGMVAHALLVDMEPKVISRVMQDAVRGKRWKYDSAHTVFDQGGSGNNWAHGYYIHGANARERTMDLVSHSLESMDCFNGFFLAQSVAGGTGSGRAGLPLLIISDI